ncbi:MAG: ATP-binding protein, partial [Caldanaerobacter sp.]
EEGKGTRIKGTFKLSSVNLIPIGDIASTIVSLIMSAPDVDIVYRFKKGDKEFEFDTKKLREVLKEVNLNDVRVLSWIRSYIEEGMKGEMEV